MTETPKVPVSSMAMAIKEMTARKHFEEQYVLVVEQNLRLGEKIKEQAAEIEALKGTAEPQAMPDAAAGATDMELADGE